MKNSFGQSVSVTLFGESHGELIGAVLDGMAPGIKADEEFIAHYLKKRAPYGTVSTMRREEDFKNFKICSGVFDGKTTGTPICIIIPNEDVDSKPYSDSYGTARPSHADYTAYLKYHGHEDDRGGGHFSGRLTAALTAAGALAACALREKGILIGTHVKRCAGANDRAFGDIKSDIYFLMNSDMPVLCKDAEREMTVRAEKARGNSDSVGGVIQTAITGVPGGIGEPWFDSMEGMLSHMMFSIPGVVGIEFGDGFALSDMYGSEANDSYRVENGVPVSEKNRCGGIFGGITSGAPIIFSCAVKPTPSIGKIQHTFDFIKNQNTDIEIKGRHDAAIVFRACAAADAAAALVLCDMLALRYGTDWLKG